MSFAKIAAAAIVDGDIGVTENPDSKKRFWKTLGLTALGIGGAAGLGYLGYRNIDSLKSMGAKATDALGITSQGPMDRMGMLGKVIPTSPLGVGAVVGTALGTSGGREGAAWTANKLRDTFRLKEIPRIGPMLGSKKLDEGLAKTFGRKTLSDALQNYRAYDTITNTATKKELPFWMRGILGSDNPMEGTRAVIDKAVKEVTPGKDTRVTTPIGIHDASGKAKFDFANELERVAGNKPSVLRDVLLKADSRYGSGIKDPLHPQNLSNHSMQDKLLREFSDRLDSSRSNPAAVEAVAKRYFGGASPAHLEAAQTFMAKASAGMRLYNKRVFGMKPVLRRGAAGAAGAAGASFLVNQLMGE